VGEWAGRGAVGVVGVGRGLVWGTGEGLRAKGGGGGWEGGGLGGGEVVLWVVVL